MNKEKISIMSSDQKSKEEQEHDGLNSLITVMGIRTTTMIFNNELESQKCKDKVFIIFSIQKQEKSVLRLLPLHYSQEDEDDDHDTL